MTGRRKDLDQRVPQRGVRVVGVDGREQVVPERRERPGGDKAEQLGLGEGGPQPVGVVGDLAVERRAVGQ
jgi:hypothetical protein